MNARQLLWATLALAFLAAGCTVQTMVPHTKGKVMISSQRTTSKALAGARPFVQTGAPHQKIQGLPAAKHAVPARLAKSATWSANHTRTRDLSADTDIASMSYTLTNLDPNSGEAAVTDAIDPWWPYIDLFLTPGQKYRIIVTVNLTASAPGVAVGITQFGDQADFVVDDYYDTYVDLYVHPVGTPVFSPIVNPSTGAVSAFNSSTGAPVTGIGAATPVPGAVTTSDKFFYSTDAKLYYFNKAQASGYGAVYQWADVTQALSTASPIIDGSNVFLDGAAATPITIEAISSDPSYAGWFWVIGFDGTNYWIYTVDTNYGSAEWWSYDVYDPYYVQAYMLTGVSAGTPTVVPTGITADIYGDVFISYYVHGITSDPIDSGILEYYNGYYSTSLRNGTGDGTVTWASNNSVYTDVSFEGGRLFALGSPLTAPAWSGASPANTGTADVFVYDYYLNQLEYSPSPVANAFSGSLAGLASSSLSRPNRFAGPSENGFLYISQTDFAATPSVATQVLSKVGTDLSSVSAP
jgi:hypothetical protein